MTDRGWKRAAILVTAVAVAVLPMAAVAKSSMQELCKDHIYTGKGYGPTEFQAFMAALQDWTDIATMHDGPKWARIDRGVPADCFDRDPHPQKSAWDCTVIHTPCRLVPAESPAMVPVPRLEATPGS